MATEQKPLRLEELSAPDADISEVLNFADGFDGYEYWGSFEKCADIANAKDYSTVENIRTCLFFEERRYNFVSCDDETHNAYQRSLVEKLREMLTSN